MNYKAMLRVGSAATCAALMLTLCACSLLPSTKTVSRPASQTDSTPKLYNPAAIDDSALRLITPQNRANGTTVLCGGKVLYQGTPGESLSLITDEATGATDFYYRSWSDPTAARGRRSAVYNKQNVELYSFDFSGYPYLSDGLLVISGSNGGMGGYTASGCEVIDLNSGKRLSVPEGAYNCIASGDLLIYSVLVDADEAALMDGASLYAVGQVIVQTHDSKVVRTFENATATRAYSTVDWVSIDATDAEGGLSSVLYQPATDTVLNGTFVGSSGIDVQNPDGTHSLYDIEQDTYVFRNSADAFYNYMPTLGLVATRDSYYNALELIDLVSGEHKPLLTIGCDSVYDTCAVLTDDNVLRVYNTANTSFVTEQNIELPTVYTYITLSPTSDGGVLVEYSGTQTPTERRAQYWNAEGLVFDTATTEGMEKLSLIYQSGVAEDGTPLFSFSSEQEDGSTTSTLLDCHGSSLLQSAPHRYDYFYSLCSDKDCAPLYVGYYTGAGRASLCDVVDIDGNVRISGLAMCYSAAMASPQDCFMAQRGYYYGLMDTSGEWVYCRSIFASLNVEDTYSYY